MHFTMQVLIYNKNTKNNSKATAATGKATMQPQAKTVAKGFDSVKALTDAAPSGNAIRRGDFKAWERGSNVTFINLKTSRSRSLHAHFLPLIKKSNRNKTNNVPRTTLWLGN